MKKWLLFIGIICITASAFAGDDMHERHHGKSGYADTVLNEIISDSRDVSIANVTVGEAADLLGTLSIAVQKDMHIEHSAAASFMFPGMGQFINDEKGAGILFMSASTAVSVGTLVGSYFLLPDSLKFDQINYFKDSYASIEAEWKAMSFTDLLPSMGVIAGGMLVDLGIRALSAKNAGRLAKTRIETGDISFEPNLLLLPGGMGIGMTMGHK